MADRRRQVARFTLPVALGLAALVVTLLIAATSRDRRGHGSGPEGSSLATVAGGSKAAYLLLDQLGHPVQRHVRPNQGYGKARLGFLLAPAEPLDEGDAGPLRTWIAGGGTLVLGVDPFRVDATAQIAQALRLPRLVVTPRGERGVALAPSWAPARSISVHADVKGGSATAAQHGPDAQDDQDSEGGADQGDVGDHGADHGGNSDRLAALVSDGRRPVALRVRKGRGQILVIDARVFSNAGLASADNALFLAVLAARHGDGQAIVFDERVHGFGSHAGVLHVAPWSLRWAVGAGALALLLYALAVGRRLGAVSALPRPPARASFEQIETLAGFFAAKRDRGPALAALAAWAGVPAPSPTPDDDASFLRAARLIAPARATGKEPDAERPNPASRP